MVLAALKTTVPRVDRLTDTRVATLASDVVSVGYGRSIAHHGEVVQGQFEEANGLHRALVTVPCEKFYSEATIYLADDWSEGKVEPKHKLKSKRSAELTLDEFGDSRGFRLLMQDNIPEGWGLGSSTSNCISGCRAAADANGTQLRPEVIAEIVVKAETASDSIMYGNRAVLFEHRAGVVLEDFAGKLPNFFVLGFNTDERGVDTLDLKPAEYNRDEIDEFCELRGLLRKAVKDQSAELIGAVATASARINQRHLPKPYFNEYLAMVGDAGGTGLQVAHSGTVIGFIFDPKKEDMPERIYRAEGLLTEFGVAETWLFEVGHERREVR